MRYNEAVVAITEDGGESFEVHRTGDRETIRWRIADDLLRNPPYGVDQTGNQILDSDTLVAENMSFEELVAAPEGPIDFSQDNQLILVEPKNENDANVECLRICATVKERVGGLFDKDSKTYFGGYVELEPDRSDREIIDQDKVHST